MVIPVGFCQVNLIYAGTAAPQGAQVTFGLENGAGGPEETAILVKDEWVTNLKGNVSGNLTLIGVLVKEGPNESGNFHLLPTNEAGAIGGDCDPPNTAILVTKNTALGGRKGRGRMYLPGVFSANTSNSGIVDAALVTNIQNDWNDFRNALEAAGQDMVLLHGDTTAPTIITSLSVQARLATQRRRLR